MPDPNKPLVVELGIEFVVELLLFLYPYGADQMNLPHNFWLGLGCWVIGSAIFIRMFWIFPVWANRLTRLEKGLIAAILISLFVVIFWKPVATAYGRRSVEQTREQERPLVPSPAAPNTQTTTPSAPEVKPLPPTKPPKHPSLLKSNQLGASQDNSVHVDKGSKIEQQTNGDCSPNIVGGSNTVNCGPPPPPPLALHWEVSSNQSKDPSEYVLMVTVTVNTTMSPVAVGVVCDTPLTKITLGTLKGRITFNEHIILDGNKAFAYYEGAPLDPKNALYITLSAAKPFSVLSVGPAKIKGLND
jgi:hypothetical protein